MSVDTHVIGYQVADEQWQRYKDVWNACLMANTSVPQEVLDYFDGEHPQDKQGREVDITEYIKEVNYDTTAGYEIDILELPKNVRYIRFENSW